MRARLDCEAKYVVEQDPWGIGQADSPRYDLYVAWIKARARTHGSALDIGCGFGAMLARLRSDFERLHGIELSADALAEGTRRHPFIDFEQGSIDALERTAADRERFDAIIFSDVLYYVEEAARQASLRWIAEHLHRDGFAFIALYSPGGREYPTPEEVRTLVEREFVIERSELLETEHLMLLARPRRRLAALTLDYETWQPLPPDRRIDWDVDVFAPTDALLDACDAEGARLTIFAELGEHAYLREHEPRVAARMEAQWRDAVERGHDVQMHLHPNWLPELGARREYGRYAWNELLTRADDHPDLEALLGRLKQVLEEAIRPINPSYTAVAFRAGGYEAQPFRRLAQALRANDIWCDSSVYHGGRRPGIYHDYSHPQHTHQPWFASHVDPQLLAPPAERGIVELPVATFARNDRWTFDSVEGARFGERLMAMVELERTAGPSTEAARAIAAARCLDGSAHEMARTWRRLANPLLPARVTRALAGGAAERGVDDDFYVAVGHSKADLDVPGIRSQLRRLREGGVEVVGLAEMALLAREQLERHAAPDARRPVEHAHERRENRAAVRCGREETQAPRLRAMIPLDRVHVLDLGCGAGASSRHIASEHPWLRVTGVDANGEIIAAAREQHACDRVDFAVAGAPALPFAEGTFDCVYADTTLARVSDIDATLSEARRVLSDGGLLIAAIPADAYGTPRANNCHTWKPSSGDVRERLRQAGFLDVSVEEADIRRLGAAPHPLALDRILLVRAWRRAAPLAQVDRVDALRRWAHARLDPSLPSDGFDPAQIIKGGFAFCSGMTLVLGEALAREGFEPRWVTMVAHEFPRGRGPRLQETHDVIEVTLADQSAHVVDPMADVRFPFSLQELIDDATLADGVERERDSTYLARRYDLYATSFWYRRVVCIAARSQPRGSQRFVPSRWAGRATQPRYQALAFLRVRGWRAIRRLRPA